MVNKGPESRVAEPLRRYWGYESLRPLQSEAIAAALDKQDSVVVLPTGGGKSLCYQLPPLVDGGITVVVSPLISLMQDQVDALKVLGYPAAALHSNVSSDAADQARADLVSGKLRLLYVSPERVLTPSMLSLLRIANGGVGISRIAIDEAHCISAWGHDFRPEYRHMSRLRETFPGVPVQALTATATPRVRQDIADQLGLESPRILVGCFDRPNLTYRVTPKVDETAQIAEAIQRYPDEASIVYCLSRKNTETVAAALVARKIKAAAYHAGLAPNVRQKISEDFAQEKLSVVVATVAFGMGIDRSNVRCVIHQTLPASIESYQQETGRAGRDGEDSECVLLYDPADIVRWSRLIRQSSEPSMLPFREKLLDEVRRYATGTQCRHVFLSNYFGQDLETEDGCGACDLCLEGWQTVTNSTKKAHIILATVRELDRSDAQSGFGAAHIAAILVGADVKAIRTWKHDKMKAYGVFRNEHKQAVAGWVNQLVDQGLLERVGDRFPTLTLPDRGHDALNQRAEIELRDIAVAGKKSRRQSIELPPVDQQLFDLLRGIRREIAQELSFAAYMIFHDTALYSLSAIRPSTIAKFAAVPGVGEKRSRDFGDRFVSAIQEFCVANNLQLDQENVRQPVPVEHAPKLNATYESLRPGFDAGRSIAELAIEFGKGTSTVTGYLVDWIKQTRPASIDPWVDPATHAKILASIRKVGTYPKRPIWEDLNGEIDYDRINVVLAFLSLSEG